MTDASFALFDETHMAIEYRYPMSLRYEERGSAPSIPEQGDVPCGACMRAR